MAEPVLETGGSVEGAAPLETGGQVRPKPPAPAAA